MVRRNVFPVRSSRNKKGDGVGKADAGGRVVG